MLKLPVIFAVDRAGLVGEDGETHHGIYDVGFLRHAPGIRILCPASLNELSDMLRWAVNKIDGPIAIRYPRGGDGAYMASGWTDATESIYTHRTGKDVTIITYGTLVNNVLEAAQILADQGIEATVLRLMCLNVDNFDKIIGKISESKKVFVAEEIAGNCSIREQLAWRLQELDSSVWVRGIDLGNRYIPHGSLGRLYDFCDLSPEKLAKAILEVHNCEN